MLHVIAVHDIVDQSVVAGTPDLPHGGCGALIEDRRAVNCARIRNLTRIFFVRTFLLHRNPRLTGAMRLRLLDEARAAGQFRRFS